MDKTPLPTSADALVAKAEAVIAARPVIRARQEFDQMAAGLAVMGQRLGALAHGEGNPPSAAALYRMAEQVHATALTLALYARGAEARVAGGNNGR